MCIVALAYQVHADYPLVWLSNRDEEFARPTKPLYQWSNGIVAGRDLRKGGTWLGVREQRLAAVTRFRLPEKEHEDAESQGGLVASFLLSDLLAPEFCAQLKLADYNPFNLLLMDQGQLFYFCSERGVCERLMPGVYVLANGFLDSDWPKVVRLREKVNAILTGPLVPDMLFTLLTDASGEEQENNAIFVRGETVGTRSSTVILQRDSELAFYERDFLAEPVLESKCVVKG